MCLAVPGRVCSVSEQEPRLGKVEFGGIVKDVCLSFVPEAQVGDYVIVHVGFAISRLDEAEAREVFAYLRQIGDLGDLDGGLAGGDTNEPPRPEVHT